MLKLHHIGIVVKNIDNAIEEYRKFNDSFEIIHCESVPREQVRIALINDNVFTIEFIEPLTNSSPIKSFLEKGGGIHHLCYETKDIEKYIFEHKERIKIVKKKGIGFYGLFTLFFVQRHANNGIRLIELVENKGDQL